MISQEILVDQKGLFWSLTPQAGRNVLRISRQSWSEIIRVNLIKP